MDELLNFGQAIEALKNGNLVCRKGWNGKGMHLWLNKGSKETPETQGTLIDGIPFDYRGLFEQGDVGTITRLPNINMRAATGNTVTGWLASQTDMLAEDWMICGVMRSE